jgi:hypothetical protein
MDQGLVNQLAQPTNHVAQAYEARTGALQKQHTDEAALQRQKDNDMLKVFEFAGDGQVNEAKYYAQTKGLEIPPEIYSNADFAKGLTLAGKIYGDDPVAAQKFTTAWIQNPQGDFQTRLAAAQGAAGKVIDPNDREYQRKINFEMWKQKNIPKDPVKLTPGETVLDGTSFKPMYSTAPKPPVDRFKAGADAYNASVQSGMSTPEQAELARNSAYAEWDSIYGHQAAPGTPAPASPGLTGTAPATPTHPGFTPAPAPLAQPQQPMTSAQPPQIPSGLPPGSVMIGTTNGRSVYQAPNGDRFVDDGNP